MALLKRIGKEENEVALLQVQLRSTGDCLKRLQRLKSMKQAFWRLRSQLRGMVVIPPRQSSTRFAYDPKSYSHNFDDAFSRKKWLQSRSAPTNSVISGEARPPERERSSRPVSRKSIVPAKEFAQLVSAENSKGFQK